MLDLGTNTCIKQILASRVHNKVGYFGGKNWEGLGGDQTGPCSLSCNLGSTLFPLYELQHRMPDLIPVLGWIPVVVLVKDDAAWFLQETRKPLR